MSILYEAAGTLSAVQILLVHAKLESIVRYLGTDGAGPYLVAEHKSDRGPLDPILDSQLPFRASRKRTSGNAVKSSVSIGLA
jgi:hypothetical protein